MHSLIWRYSQHWWFLLPAASPCMEHADDWLQLRLHIHVNAACCWRPCESAISVLSQACVGWTAWHYQWQGAADKTWRLYRGHGVGFTAQHLNHSTGQPAHHSNPNNAGSDSWHPACRAYWLPLMQSGPFLNWINTLYCVCNNGNKTLITLRSTSKVLNLIIAMCVIG